MGSKPLLIVLWLAGTTVAAGVAWRSLSFVSASTEGGDLTAATDSADRAVGGAGTVGDGDGSLPFSSTISPTVPTSEPSTTVASPSGDQSTPTTATATSVAGATSTTTTSVPVTQSGAIEQTFEMTGGTAVIRFSPKEVTVVWATPAFGYAVDSHPEGGGVEVEFSNGVHESKIEAWWDGGPRSDTRERAE